MRPIITAFRRPVTTIVGIDDADDELVQEPEEITAVVEVTVLKLAKSLGIFQGIVFRYPIAIFDDAAATIIEKPFVSNALIFLLCAILISV